VTYQKTIALDHPTTTETLSGRTYDGVATYIKLLQQSGAVSTGNFDIAHGITGLVRIVAIYGGAHVADGTEVPIPNSGSGSTDVLSVRDFGTTGNIRVTVGTAWTTSIELSDIWLVVEYTK